MTPEEYDAKEATRKGLRAAAVELLSDATHLTVEQVDSIVLRESDRNEENPRMVELVPIGDVLGIRIYRKDSPPRDEDDGLAFVSMRAFASALPALGLVASPGVAVGPRSGVPS